jgi:hypothetical protein
MRIVNDGIFESDAFGITFSKPVFCGFRRRKDLKVVNVADFPGCIDVNPDCHA